MTKATDYVFVFDNIGRAFKVNKPKVVVKFAEAVGWNISHSRMNSRDMDVEYHGKKDGGEEEMLPDYGDDLEALLEHMTNARLIIGPEYPWFEERRRPTGWAIYKTWEDIALDYIDRLGSVKALAISSSLHVAIMLAYMVRKQIDFDLEEMK